MTSLTEYRQIRHFHIFCGLGGGAKGFNAGSARVGNLSAHMRCIGGIDVDPAALRDFEKLSGVKGTLLDLFSREQYIYFHGKEPASDWREATPQDVQRAAGYERPHIVFQSPPCKGYSGLLSQSRSLTPKYQALNVPPYRNSRLGASGGCGPLGKPAHFRPRSYFVMQSLLYGITAAFFIVLKLGWSWLVRRRDG